MYFGPRDLAVLGDVHGRLVSSHHSQYWARDDEDQPAGIHDHNDGLPGLYQFAASQMLLRDGLRVEAARIPIACVVTVSVDAQAKGLVTDGSVIRFAGL